MLRLRFLKVRGRYLQHDVDDEERQGAERNRTVDGLGQDPVPGRHHDPVGGHDPHADRAGKRQKCEYSTVLEQEMVGRGQHDMTG